MGWRPPYCMPDDSSAFWELAEMQMEFPGSCAVICWHQVGHAVSGARKLENISPEIPGKGWKRLVLVQPCLRSGFLAALAQIICFSTADGNADR